MILWPPIWSLFDASVWPRLARVLLVAAGLIALAVILVLRYS